MPRSVANTSVILKKYCQLLLHDKEECQDINIRNSRRAITTFFSFNIFSVIEIS